MQRPRITGYRADEVLGRPCYEIFGSEQRPGCHKCQPDCPVTRAARNQELVPTYNMLGRTKAGAPILLNISVIVPLERHGSVCTVHLFWDATHQLRYETYDEQSSVPRCSCSVRSKPWPSTPCRPRHASRRCSARGKESSPMRVPGSGVVPEDAIETTARAGLLPPIRLPMIPTSSDRTTANNGLRVFMFRSFSFASQGGREDFVGGLETRPMAWDRGRQRSHDGAPCRRSPTVTGAPAVLVRGWQCSMTIPRSETAA